MNENKRSKNYANGSIGFLLLLTVLIALLAWITYGTFDGIIGALAFTIVGLLNVFPWFIPFVGIPLGILDALGIFGFGMYNITLNLAHLSSSWMTFIWFWLIGILGSIIDIILMYFVISGLKKLKYRKKEPHSNYALINCSIIDGTINSPVIKKGIVLIKNIVGEEGIPGLISGVGSEGKLDIPDDYKIIDLKGEYLLPGLINAHCHLTGSGKPMKIMNLGDKTLEKLIKLMGTALGKKILSNMMKSNVSNALNAGVTTLKTMSDPFYLDLKLRNEINKGKFLGPRLVCAGMGICITGGHGGLIAYIADSPTEVKKAIRKNLRAEVDFIKILSTGGVMDSRKVGEAGRPQMTIEEIETACFEAHRGGILVATHCESTDGIKEALLGGVDSIEHGAEITDDLVPLFKNNPKSHRGFTTLTSTVSAGMGMAVLSKEETKITDVKKENAVLIEKGMINGLQKAYKEGIKLTVGTDASVPYSTHYNVWKELKYFMKYTGMSAQEAIHYATKGNADNIGIGDVTGSIEFGKFADIQVVQSNPLENIDSLGNVSMVFIKGHQIKNPKVKKVKNLTNFEPIEL